VASHRVATRSNQLPGSMFEFRPMIARTSAEIDVHALHVVSRLPGTPGVGAPVQNENTSASPLESACTSRGAISFPSARSAARATIATPSGRTQEARSDRIG